jgi:DNA-binding MarR family transcriptional regulator
LHIGYSQNASLVSTLTSKQLSHWRTYVETWFALIDILDAELQADTKLTLVWYDALVHLEGAADGVGMTELANRILASKSGLTRVIDRMESAGLVRRERPPEDRRVVKVFITPEGAATLREARVVHHRGIHEHFVKHLSEPELASVADMLEAVREHVRPLRPGRISNRTVNRSPR